MKILITGTSGLIGSNLVEFLFKRGHTIKCLLRDKDEALQPYTMANLASIESQDDEGIEAVIHLAGENLTQGRWTRTKKQRILESRINGTRFLAKYFAQSARKPKVFISASAVSYYGDRSSSPVVDNSLNGTTFLADVCQQWEEATEPAAAAGIRVVNARFGVVLSPKGGLLNRIVPTTQKGLAGVLGNGKQYISWISMPDVVKILDFILVNSKLEGPVNIVSPNPVTNATFIKTLSTKLHKPALLPLPAFAVRLLYGQLADELLLPSTRAIPKKLKDLGYTFVHPTLDDALDYSLAEE